MRKKMAKISYELELEHANRQWDQAFKEALNGIVNQTYLLASMTRLQALLGKKLQQEIADLERKFATSHDDELSPERKEMNNDIKRLREKFQPTL